MGRFVETRSFLAFALCIAALLRLWNVLAIIRSAPWLQHLQLDQRLYDEWGQHLATGDWIGTRAYFVDPLYAYFLGLLDALAGHELAVVLFVQAALGVGTCYLTALLGRRTCGPRVGNLAALTLALYGPAIYYEGLIEKTALSMFLFASSLALFFGQTRRQTTLAAVCLGLAALTRGNFLAFIPLGVVALLVRGTPRFIPDDSQRQGLGHRILASARANGEPAARFLMASFLVVSVALIRNSLVAGVVATTTNFGQNLYIGNHAGNLDGAYASPPFVRPDPQFEEADFRAEAERRVGRDLDTQEVSAYWRQEALSEIVEHPGLSVTRALKKIGLFWNDYEIPDNGSMELAAEWSPVLRFPLLSMGILFPLALLGGVLSFRSGGPARGLTVVAVVYCATIVPFFVVGRLRIQVLPVVSVLAMSAATRLAAAVRSCSLGRAARYAGVVLLGALFSLTAPSWLKAKEKTALAIDYNNLGALYVEEDRPDMAIKAYEKAVQTDPASVVGAMRALGDLYLARDDYANAERYMRQVISLKPQSRLAREALARLYDRMWRDRDYRGDREVLRRKASEAYRQAGRAIDLEGAAVLAAPRIGPAEPAGVSGPIAAATADAILRGLSAAGTGHPVWFASSAGDASAETLGLSLRQIFERAGWVVRRADRVGFPIKPGLFIFAADPTPPDYVTRAYSALLNAGIAVAFNAGYRSFYDDMKQRRPDWNGFAMSPEQTFVIVVGPQPR